MNNYKLQNQRRVLQEPYDLEVVVPFCMAGKYRNRIAAFRQYGLLNLGDHRVRLIVLVSQSDLTEFAAEFAEGWPCDVAAVACNGSSMGAKVHQFYSSLPLDYEQKARWFARVDDDSCTDVGGLLNQLDTYYDDQDPDYLMADVCHDLDLCYQQILHEIGAAGLIAPNDRGKGITQHEWEGCVLSRAAFGRMLKHSVSQIFWERCRLLTEGLADHPLAVAAQLAKVHPSDCWFMTSQSELEEFSLFGGKYVHVHFITWDKQDWPEFTRRLQDAGYQGPSSHFMSKTIQCVSIAENDRSDFGASEFKGTDFKADNFDAHAAGEDLLSPCGTEFHSELSESELSEGELSEPGQFLETNQFPRVMRSASLSSESSVQRVAALEEGIERRPPNDALNPLRGIRTLFLTVADAVYFPGTVAMVNSVLCFHPSAEIIIVNNNQDQPGLSDTQKHILAHDRICIVDADCLDGPGRRLGAWQLKAYGAHDLTEEFDVLVGIDSDCILCGPIDDVIAGALMTGSFHGGSDGVAVYDASYEAYAISPLSVNEKYMSTSLYICALTGANRRELGRWADCCNDALFGGGEIYAGYGDQGVLNALLFQRRGPAGVELLDNRLWSQHWCYWDDTLEAQEGILVHAALRQPQRSMHCGAIEKFWERAHADKLAEHPTHIVNYAWFLSLFWFGQCRDWAKDPAQYLSPEVIHLAHDVAKLLGEVSRVNPQIVEGQTHQLPAWMHADKNACG